MYYLSNERCMPTSDECGCAHSIYATDPQCDLASLTPLCRYVYEYVGRINKRGKPLEITGWNFQPRSISTDWNPLYTLNDVGNHPGIFAELTNLNSIWIGDGYQTTEFPAFVSPSLKYIWTDHSFKMNSGEEGMVPGVGHVESFCPAMDDWNTRFTLTTDGFLPETFQNVQNLEELSLHSMYHVRMWDIGIDYFVENLPNLKRLDMLATDYGKECKCASDPTNVAPWKIGYCDICQTIDFCRVLCGVHPTLESCRPNMQYYYRLTCDKSNAAWNGTWDNDEARTRAEAKLIECEENRQQNPLCTDDEFFNVGTKTCDTTTCTCVNGTAALGTACPSNGDSLCASCDTSYALSNGECLSTTTNCGSHNGDVCEGCDPGYSLIGSFCEYNVCSCGNGTGASGVDCPVTGSEMCISCNSGFTLGSSGSCCSNTGYHVSVNGTCEINQCVCPNGEGAIGAECDTHGEEQCVSCVGGGMYYLSNERCMPTSDECGSELLNRAARTSAARGTCRAVPRRAGIFKEVRGTKLKSRNW